MRQKVEDLLKVECSNLYLRPADYNRARALTQFIKEMRKKYKEDFQIDTANIKNIHRRNSDTRAIETDGEVMFYNYANFILKGTKYYVQYVDNPFFDSSYIARCENDRNVPYQKMERIFSYGFEIEDVFVYSEENIKKLTKDLHKQFKEVKTDNYTTATRLNDQQTIYTR